MGQAVFSSSPPSVEAYIVAGEPGAARNEITKPSHISLGKQLEDVTVTVPHKLRILFTAELHHTNSPRKQRNFQSVRVSVSFLLFKRFDLLLQNETRRYCVRIKAKLQQRWVLKS
jgi:hypothetical protein